MTAFSEPEAVHEPGLSAPGRNVRLMTTPQQLTSSGVQTSLEDLGTPLSEVTFVVVDLETTGGRPEAEGITEIGAVKVRGGQVLGEFATLVDPGRDIPVQIQRLTGITTTMIHDAPRIAGVLPSFLEFLGSDTVLVAHNAGFDVGFLKAACSGHGLRWPTPHVVDTVKLARALVPRDEARNHRLGTLAALFGSSTTPNHRALADARATVDVLHALFARLGSLGVTTREDLLTFSTKVPAGRRRRAALADALPESPGVYIFKNEDGVPLYIGTSMNIKRRVKGYFTASERRRDMGLMVDLSRTVTPIPCSTALEAHVREIRMIVEHRPRFNKRSTRPEKLAWLKVTRERFPRLSVVRAPRRDGGLYVGPFRSHAAARAAREAIYEVRRIRQCTQAIPLKGAPACILAEIGRCDAPCRGGVPPEAYASRIVRLREELEGDTSALVHDIESRLARLAQDERFEEARATRDALIELLRGVDRHQRRRPLVGNPELTAARPGSGGGWEFAVIRYGRLAGAARSSAGRDPRPVLDAVVATAENVAPDTPTLVEETDVILRWLEQPGTRLVASHMPWTSPLRGAGQSLSRLDPLFERAREIAWPGEARC